MKKWIIPLAVLLVVPALGAAAPIYVGPVPERLVEGHTVFTVLEQVNATAIDKEQYAAAVAVLVREATARETLQRFPGVLWFNDQYLVDPVDNKINANRIRHPCTGAVLAVNSGDPDPRPAFEPTYVPQPTYLESYHITDPNDHVWDVDKWSVTVGAVVFTTWTVAILNDQAGYDVKDDGAADCDPYEESRFIPLPLCQDGTEYDGTVLFSAPMRCFDERYPTGNRTDADTNPSASAAPPLKYNAVLYFFLEDLTVVNGPKGHHSGSWAAGDDYSGCQANTDPIFPDQWPCLANNDDREGNSHPYNPFVGGSVCAYCTGRFNHGSANYGAEPYVHETRNIDLYFHIGKQPGVRTYILVDTEGSTAPFFCQDAFDYCIPTDQ